MLIGIQGMLFGFNMIGMFKCISVRIIAPYLLFKIVRLKLFNYLVNIIYATTLYTLFIWFLQNVIPSFYSYLVGLSYLVYNNIETCSRYGALLFYTIQCRGEIDLFIYTFQRNSGLYHEPGAFAYWLIMGIALNSIINNKMFDKKNIVMIFALITTFSTTGYLALFVLLSFHAFYQQKDFFIKIITIGLFLLIAYFAFDKLDFMGNKVSEHWETQKSLELEGRTHSGRIIRARKALSLLSYNPVFGRGIISASDVHYNLSASYYEGAGTMRIISSFGIIFAPIIFLFYYRGILYLCALHGTDKRYAVFVFAAITMGGMSQMFFMDFISIQLFLVGLLYYKQTNQGKTTAPTGI